MTTFVAFISNGVASYENAWRRALERTSLRCQGGVYESTVSGVRYAVRGNASESADASTCGALTLLEGWFYSVSPSGVESAVSRSASALGGFLSRAHNTHSEFSQIVDLFGVFAFANVELATGRVVLAVDRFGGKPLYYAQTELGFVVSPCLRAVSEFCSDLSLDDDALVDVLSYRMLVARHSLVKGVFQVEPGTVVVRESNGAISIQRLWRLDFGGCGGDDGGVHSIEEWEGRVSSALKSSVSALCASTPRVNVFLSGGVDSSILASFVAESDVDVTAITLEVEGWRNPEIERARSVADKLGLPLEVVQVRMREIADNYHWLAERFDHPPRNINNLALLALYRRASELGGAVISGVAADALFGASEPRRVGQLIERARYRNGLGPKVASAIGQVVSACAIRPGRLSRLAEALRIDVEDRCKMLERLEFSKFEESQVLRAAHGRIVSDDLRESVWVGDESLIAKTRRLNVNLRTRSEMVRNDRIGTALGVDTLYPFLGREVAALAFAFPDALHRVGGFSKPVLRSICAKRVSPDVAYWSKMGFPSPTHEWIDGPLAQIRDDMVRSNGVLDAVVPRTERARLDAHRDFELTWTLMNLKSVCDSMGVS